MNAQDYMVEGSDYLVSLTKLVGDDIADVMGYVTYEFGDATFKLSQVVFKDGTTVWVGGEHDCAYLEYGKDAPKNLGTETLEALWPMEDDE